MSKRTFTPSPGQKLDLLPSAERPSDIFAREFIAFSRFPHQSGHCEAISDYLYDWAVTRGFAVVQDEFYNIIIDKPAASGKEDQPLCVLQGHMDMVCVAREGYAYDPVNDPIKVINDGVTLSTEGTSLGGDDGLGIAMAQYMLQADLPLGPMRALFTVDEETTMKGAANLDPKYLADAKYLFSLDFTKYGYLVTSTAGGLNEDITKTPSSAPPTLDTALCALIHGLRGGHSGIDINDNRLNAVRFLLFALLALDMAKIPYEIATFNGGVAENVIPSKAEATLVIRQTDKAAVEAVFAHSFSLAKDAYGAYETDMAFACEATALPELVLCKADKDGFIALTTGIHDGLYNVHNSDKSLSRTSSNIGIIALTAQSIFIEILARSSDELFLDQINHSHINLANCFGFTTHTHSRLPAWPNDTNAHLPHIMAEAYKRQTDTDAVICLVHGNAEGSWFYTKNPRMEIVGCGSESMGYHTPSETLYLNSVNDFVKVLIDAIEHLG